MTSPASGVVGAVLLRASPSPSDELAPYRDAGVQYPCERRSQDELNVRSLLTQCQLLLNCVMNDTNSHLTCSIFAILEYAEAVVTKIEKGKSGKQLFPVGLPSRVSSVCL